MAVLSFAFLGAAVMHGGWAGAEPGKTDGNPTAEIEDTAGAVALASSCSGGAHRAHSDDVGLDDLCLSRCLFRQFDSSTGNNCAMTVAAGPAYGHASFIDVVLYRCKQTSPGPTCTYDADPGDPGEYQFFAGPVSVHAPGRCISAFGELTYGNVTVYGELAGAKHCS